LFYEIRAMKEADAVLFGAEVETLPRDLGEDLEVLPAFLLHLLKTRNNQRLFNPFFRLSR
jgi:hypothetical protein